MLNVKKCMCWYSSIIELKNARWNIETKYRSFKLLIFLRQIQRTSNLYKVALIWNVLMNSMLELTYVSIQMVQHSWSDIQLLYTNTCYDTWSSVNSWKRWLRMCTYLQSWIFLSFNCTPHFNVYNKRNQTARNTSTGEFWVQSVIFSMLTHFAS